jgi:hypothetical protein
MFRILTIMLLTTTAAYANHCDTPINFEEEITDELAVDGFEVGYTSGYRRIGSKYEFTYCVENLHRDSWVFFKWKGPAPDMFIEGYLSKKPRRSRNAKVETWRDSPGPSDDEARDLSLSLERDSGYSEYEVQSIFEDAALQTEPILRRVQGDGVFDLSATSSFVQSIRNDPVALQNGRFSLSAGVIFDVPSNPELLDGYPEVQTDEEPEELSKIRASVAVRYDLVTLEVSMTHFVGFSRELPEPNDINRFFDALELAFEIGPGAVDLENIDFIKLSDGEPAEINQYAGVSRSIPLGSLADVADASTPAQRATLPVILLLNGNPLYRFNLDIVGLPADI